MHNPTPSPHFMPRLAGNPSPWGLIILLRVCILINIPLKSLKKTKKKQNSDCFLLGFSLYNTNYMNSASRNVFKINSYIIPHVLKYTYSLYSIFITLFRMNFINFRLTLIILRLIMNNDEINDYTNDDTNDDTRIWIE